ncbi:MAG: helix-turn-helix domain-containing protein [Rickettsia endosymbiont of Bryobia graminum]|nr:helix-turn-helix domain-containing protein [Rickettsia endosymbiont of Bryobia graminum]
MRAYSQDLRNKVINKYKEGTMTKMAISKLYGICYESGRDWVRRYTEDGDYSSKQGVGCGRVLRFDDKDKILGYLKLNLDENGIEVRIAGAPDLPISIFYDTLARLKITYKKKSQNINSEVRWIEEIL